MMSNSPRATDTDIAAVLGTGNATVRPGRLLRWIGVPAMIVLGGILFWSLRSGNHNDVPIERRFG